MRETRGLMDCSDGAVCRFRKPVASVEWYPPSFSARILAEGRPLPQWGFRAIRSGSRNSVRSGYISITSTRFGQSFVRGTDIVHVLLRVRAFTCSRLCLIKLLVLSLRLLVRARFLHPRPLRLDGSTAVVALLQLIKLLSKQQPGELPVLLPATCMLALDHDSCRQMFQLHSARRFVDFLAAWAGSAKEGLGDFIVGDLATRRQLFLVCCR